MRPKSKHPQPQAETLMIADLQVFEGEALSPDDPRVQGRVRRGRPQDRSRRSTKKGRGRKNGHQ